MIEWTDDQLKAAGINKRKLKKVVRLLEESSALMWSMGLHVYGASGSGCLVHKSRPTHIDTPMGNSKADQGCVVARVGEGYDGGDW